MIVPFSTITHSPISSRMLSQGGLQILNENIGDMYIHRNYTEFSSSLNNHVTWAAIVQSRKNISRHRGDP